MCGQGWAAHFPTDFIKTGLNMSPSTTYNARERILRYFEKQAYTEQNPEVPLKWTIFRKFYNFSQSSYRFSNFHLQNPCLKHMIK